MEGEDLAQTTESEEVTAPAPSEELLSDIQFPDELVDEVSN